MTRRSLNADGGLSEAAWQSQVFGLLRFYGWRFHHSPDNRPTVVAGGRAGRQHVGDRGFLDVLATRHLEAYGPELVVAELKTDKGRYGPGQPEWIAALEAFAAGVHASGKIACQTIPVHELPAIIIATWRPRDRDDVEAILAGPAGIGVMVDRSPAAVRGLGDY
jgi:hypothetical protein